MEILVPTKNFLFIFSIGLYSSKQIGEEKKKGDVVDLFKSNKTFDKFMLQLSTEITLGSCIEINIIIYKIEICMKLHNKIWC